jgi:Spy/CpxP family protein refolding chaperone
MSILKKLCLVLAIPAALCAQPSRAGMFPWWESPVAKTLNLSETQLRQIHSVTREYRNHLFEVRTAVDKAERDFDQVFNEDSVDQAKGAEAIDRLVKAKSEMTKTVSEMSLRLRAVLTPQQWQDLQRSQKGQQQSGLEPASGSGPARGAGRGPGRGPGRGRHGGPNDTP